MQWKYNTKEILLLIILLIAFVLRFYQFGELPFMWDELSAWNRLHFDSFSELIELGVKPDGHPAGVQVFLYYWTHLFGDTEWIVKLPFALMGVASVLVFYKIGEIWWNKTVSLLSASFMSSLQFFVLYSTLARPYISGLFLTLMMVYFWSLYMFRSPKRKFLFGYIIFSALSAYNHHFSLLLAAIVGLSGLAVLPKGKLKEYMMSGLLIFILYIPHLSIFFHQLGIGGIGGEGNWLSKPNPSFFWQFLFWAFHYSILLVITVVFIVLLSLFNRSKLNVKKQKWIKKLLLLLWFFLPFLIGYYYSVFVNPVIQFSMLIFGFPYLLLLLFSGFKEIKSVLLAGMVIVILFITTSTLIINRKHFEIIKKQIFNSSALCLNSQQNIQAKNIFFIYNTIPAYQEYYLKKYHLDRTPTISIYNKKFTLVKFDSILSHISQDYILISGLPESLVPLVKLRFPNLIERTNGYTYESYLFSRKEQASVELHQLVSSSNSWFGDKDWSIPQDRLSNDSLGNKYFSFSNKQEWGFSFKDSLHIIMPERSIIDMQIDIITDSLPLNAVLVGIFSISGQKSIWRGQAFKENLVKTDLGYRLFYSLDTRLLMNTKEFERAIFKAYIWNKANEKFNVQEMKVFCRNANPIKYGLFSPILEPRK